MARTSVATDNFNRASLGADWAQLCSYNGTISTTGSTYIYASGYTTPGLTGAMRWVGAGTFTDDQYSSLVIGVLAYENVNINMGVIVRASADNDSTSALNTRDFYGVSVCLDAGGPNYTTVLYKVVNGTVTSLNSGSASWAVNDRIELEVEGTTLRVCKNGTALGGSWTVTDSSLTTGNPGVAMSSGGNASFYADDWEGGNLGGAAASAVKRSLLLGIG